SNALKAEARDTGPTVLPVSKEAGRPFSSQPGSMERAVYRGFSQKGKVKQRTRRRPKSSYEFAVPLIPVIAAMWSVSKFYGEISAFLDLTLGLGILAVAPAHYLERFQQPTQVARQNFCRKAGSLRACASSLSVTSSFMALVFERFEKIVMKRVCRKATRHATT